MGKRTEAKKLATDSTDFLKLKKCAIFEMALRQAQDRGWNWIISD
jgi:hypothetical protein